MKYTKYFTVLIITSLAILTLCQFSTAQNNAEDKKDAKKAAIKNMVDSQHFVFVAQSATPVRGQFRNLTSSYDVSISRDTLISYLPYFGRAYSAPLDPTKAGLDFTATDFSYVVTPHKKDGWNVLIKPTGNTDVQQLLFTIFDNGSATLNVTSISRDPISFNGYIANEKKKTNRK